MKRLIFNVIVGLLTFIDGVAITSFFVMQISKKSNVAENDGLFRINSCYYKANLTKDIPGDWKKVDFGEFPLYLPSDMSAI